MTAYIMQLFIKSGSVVNIMCERSQVEFLLKVVQNVHAKYINE